MVRPSPDELRLAAEWLRQYDTGQDPDETTGMYAVANWLEDQASAARLRATAKANNVPVRSLRKVLRRRLRKGV